MTKDVEFETPLQLVNKYTIEHFTSDQIKGQIKNRMMFVCLGENKENMHIPISQVAGLVQSFFEKDGQVYVKWKPFTNDRGKAVKKIAKKKDAKYTIRPIGLGIVTKEGEVEFEDYKLFYLALDAA